MFSTVIYLSTTISPPVGTHNGGRAPNADNVFIGEVLNAESVPLFPGAATSLCVTHAYSQLTNAEIWFLLFSVYEWTFTAQRKRNSITLLCNERVGAPTV